MRENIDPITPSGRRIKRRPKSRLSEAQKYEIAKLAQDSPSLTHQDIADVVDVDRTTVTRTLGEYKIVRDKLDRFKAHRADIFAGMQQRVLSSITLADIKKASLKDKTILLGTVFDKEQVLTGHGVGQNTIGVMVSIACKVGENAGERVSQVAVEVRSGQQSGQIIDVNSSPTNEINEIGHDGNER